MSQIVTQVVGFNNYNELSGPFTLNELSTYDTVKFSKWSQNIQRQIDFE